MSTVKVNRQGHVIFFNIFDIPDLENVRIDTKINFVSLLFRKYHNLRTGVQLDPRLATTLVFPRYLLRVKGRIHLKIKNVKEQAKERVI